MKKKDYSVKKQTPSYLTYIYWILDDRMSYDHKDCGNSSAYIYCDVPMLHVTPPSFIQSP